MLDFLKEIISNYALLISVSAWAICQLLKFIIHCIVERKVDFSRFIGDGGMPSAHSATVVSLAVASGYFAGWDSVPFAVAMMFAIVVMRDAMGVRREAGKQAESIKELADAMNKAFLDDDDEIRTENLKVLVGHTPLQVLFGALLGVLVAVLAIIIFPI